MIFLVTFFVALSCTFLSSVEEETVPNLHIQKQQSESYQAAQKLKKLKMVGREIKEKWPGEPPIIVETSPLRYLPIALVACVASLATYLITTTHDTIETTRFIETIATAFGSAGDFIIRLLGGTITLILGFITYKKIENCIHARCEMKQDQLKRKNEVDRDRVLKRFDEVRKEVKQDIVEQRQYYEKKLITALEEQSHKNRGEIKEAIDQEHMQQKKHLEEIVTGLLENIEQLRREKNRSDTHTAEYLESIQQELIKIKNDLAMNEAYGDQLMHHVIPSIMQKIKQITQLADRLNQSAGPSATRAPSPHIAATTQPQ